MDYVRCEGVHKSFLRKYGAPTLRAHVSKTQRDKVDRALIDISFTVGSGEAIGVIGRRRSGKSTLISVLNGLYRPDQGTVHVRGRPTGPIAMSVGFASDMPAADNITLNAQLLGMSHDEIESRRDAIIAFSGLKPAELATRCASWSPRRRQRLGYSVVLHAEPDVFLADGRVLVGDKEFRDASMARLEADARRRSRDGAGDEPASGAATALQPGDRAREGRDRLRRTAQARVQDVARAAGRLGLGASEAEQPEDGRIEQRVVTDLGRGR